VTCVLCIVCARNVSSPAIYGATLSSFVIALLHFTSELLLFKTMTLTSALPTLIIAGISTAWMSLGWGYYTQSSKTFIDKVE